MAAGGRVYAAGILARACFHGFCPEDQVGCLELRALGIVVAAGGNINKCLCHDLRHLNLEGDPLAVFVYHQPSHVYLRGHPYEECAARTGECRRNYFHVWFCVGGEEAGWNAKIVVERLK